MKQFEKDKNNLWFALFPTDAPFIPVKYIDNFINNLPSKKIVMISKINNKIEPMFSFWSLKALISIEEELLKSDGVKIMKIAEKLNYEILEFNTSNAKDFMNINTKEDYLKIKELSRIAN